jgi:hypothetical protein
MEQSFFKIQFNITLLVLAIAASGCQNEKFAASTPQAATTTSPSSPAGSPAPQPVPAPAPTRPNRPPRTPPPQSLPHPLPRPWVPAPQPVPTTISVPPPSIEFITPVISFFVEKRIIFLGISDEFTREAYNYEMIFLWYLYGQGYRTIGIEESSTKGVTPSDADAIGQAKIQSVRSARERVRAYLQTLNAHRIPGSEPLKFFTYNKTSIVEVKNRIQNLPPGEKVILIGHNLNLNRDPAAPLNVGSAVSQIFPAQVLSIWMINGEGSDSGFECELSICRVSAASNDISQTLTPEARRRGFRNWLFPSVDLPGPLSQKYSFLTDLGEVTCELKVSADLIFYAGRVRAL